MPDFSPKEPGWVGINDFDWLTTVENPEDI